MHRTLRLAFDENIKCKWITMRSFLFDLFIVMQWRVLAKRGVCAVCPVIDDFFKVSIYSGVVSRSRKTIANAVTVEPCEKGEMLMQTKWLNLIISLLWMHTEHNNWQSCVSAFNFCGTQMKWSKRPTHESCVVRMLHSWNLVRDGLATGLMWIAWWNGNFPKIIILL